MGIVADCPYLADSVKMDAVAYPAFFFELLETPEVIVENQLTTAVKD
ncbi:MAG: hypothetical protein R2788_05690 [Saprospiraceae bacterium]